MKEGFGEASSGEGMSLLGGTSSSNGASGHDGDGCDGDGRGDGEVVVRMQEAGDSNSSNSSSSNHLLTHKKEGVLLQPSYRHCQKNYLKQCQKHRQSIIPVTSSNCANTSSSFRDSCFSYSFSFLR
jgi:hypothetical protein